MLELFPSRKTKKKTLNTIKNEVRHASENIN